MIVHDTEENRVKIQGIADYLLGSSADLSDALETTFGEDPDVSIDLLVLLDSIVMQCESCGWWIPSDEIDDDGNCPECSEP